MTPDQILLPAAGAGRAVIITGVARAGWKSCMASLASASRRWAEAHGFAGEPGRHLAIPDGKGAIDRVLWGIGERKAADPFAAGRLARLLPAGRYAFGDGFASPRLAALAGVSKPIVSTAIASPLRQRLCCTVPRALTVPTFCAPPRPPGSPAIWSTRRPRTWARRKSSGP